jgi:hypothetical protein
MCIQLIGLGRADDEQALASSRTVVRFEAERVSLFTSTLGSMKNADWWLEA